MGAPSVVPDLLLLYKGCAGIFGAYSFYRSFTECLGKVPACNLAPGSLIFCSSLTSFLMLGWKLGQAYRINTKMQELEKYGALYQQVVVAYGGDVAQRLKELANDVAGAVAPALGASMHLPQSPASNHPAGASAPTAPHPPAHSVASAGLQQVPANHGAAVSSAHAPAHPAGATEEFLVHQVVPAAVAPNLSAVPHSAAPVAHAQEAISEEVEVRGVCDGCGENVTSNDEGRKREGNKYYHEDCVKGLCGYCHKIVHADSVRVVIDGEYWHTDCTSNIAGPSSQPDFR